MNRHLREQRLVLLFPSVLLLWAASWSSRGPAETGQPAAVVLASPALDGQPYGVAITPGGVVLVAQVFRGTVARYGLPDTLPVASLGAGMQPVHVAIDPAGTRAYVVDQAGQSLLVLRLDPFAVLAHIPLSNDGFNVAVAPSGRRVYVTTADGRIYVLDAATSTIVDSMQVGPAANGLAFSPCGDRLYVSSRDAGTVTAFDTRTNVPLDTIRTGGAPQRLAISRDGGTLFVANEASGIDVATLPGGVLRPSIRLDGSGYGLALSPDGLQLYATNPLSGRVFIVEVADHYVIDTLRVGGAPRNVAFSRDGRFAVVTDGNGRVLFIRPQPVGRPMRPREVERGCTVVAVLGDRMAHPDAERRR